MFITVVCVSFQKNLANIRKTMQANDFSSNYSHCELVNEYQDIGGWGILSANSKVSYIRGRKNYKTVFQRKLPVSFKLAFSHKNSSNLPYSTRNRFIN